jgi:hypothetical protein
MSKDPEQCSVKKTDGTRCQNKPMYKIGRSGFCEEHRSLAVTQSKRAAGAAVSFDPERLHPQRYAPGDF